MRSRKLTDRQRETLNIIRQHLSETGVPPSRSELSAALGLGNPSAADAHLVPLARKGWIEVHAGMDRGIRLLREGTPILEPDELAGVPAGRPIAEMEPRGGQRLPSAINAQFEPEPDCFLRVTDAGMSGAGIRSGDIVALRYRAKAKNGDLVVAQVRDQLTLTRFSHTGNGPVRLETANPENGHDAIEIAPATADCAVVGVVVGAIIRKGPIRQEETERVPESG